MVKHFNLLRAQAFRVAILTIQMCIALTSQVAAILFFGTGLKSRGFMTLDARSSIPKFQEDRSKFIGLNACTIFSRAMAAMLYLGSIRRTIGFFVLGTWIYSVFGCALRKKPSGGHLFCRNRPKIDKH